MVSGELFATIPGILETRKLYVVNLVFLTLSVLQVLLGMVRGMERYGWAKCSALVMRGQLRIVGTEGGVFTTVVTTRMLQSFV